MESKKCTKCQTVKPLTEFYKTKRGLYGHSSRCKACQIKDAVIWAKAHPERALANGRKSWAKWKAKNPGKRWGKDKCALERNYGIPEAFRDAFIKYVQGGRCDCCGRTDMKRLVTDHNHATKVIRGWICDPCNHAIGMLETTPQRVYAAVDYIKRCEAIIQRGAARE